jgi:hypothetical protein
MNANPVDLMIAKVSQAQELVCDNTGAMTPPRHTIE